MNDAKNDAKNKRLRLAHIYGRLLYYYFKIIPVAAVTSVLDNLLRGFWPAVTALVLARLFVLASAVIEFGDASELWRTGLLYLCLYAGYQVWIFFCGVIRDLGNDKNQVNYRYMICQKLAKLPLIDFENTELRDKHRRAEECLYDGHMGYAMRGGLDLVLNGLVSIVSVSVVLARYSLLFLPLCVLSVAPYCVARLIRGKEFYNIKRGQTKKQRRTAYLWSLFTDRRTLKELRVFGADDYIYERWTETRDETQTELFEQSRKDAVSYAICDALRIVGYAACILISLWLTLRGELSVGVFGACIAAFLALQNSTRHVLVLGGDLPATIAFAGDYFEFIDLPDEPVGTDAYTGLRDRVELRNVSFKYPNADEYALRDVSLTINKGEKIAILGENGSGKTTLTKLIFGVLPAPDGEILYDGVNVDALDKTALYNTVSVTTQNFVQYRFSLRENIAISNTAGINNDADIESALAEAGLSGLLAEYGLDAELGHAFGGSDLSGGQWQKLAIARCLFRPSKLIILDEPTSALDPLIETEILSTFIDLVRDKTAIIISHRVGLCRLVDKIAVMSAGRLVEFGSHAELIDKNGEYARLFTAQEKWYI